MCLIGTLIKKLVRCLCENNLDENYRTEVMEDTPYIVDYESHSQRSREQLNARHHAQFDSCDEDTLMRMWNQRKTPSEMFDSV
jgi:hypothetical protein